MLEDARRENGRLLEEERRENERLWLELEGVVRHNEDSEAMFVVSKRDLATVQADFLLVA